MCIFKLQSNTGNFLAIGPGNEYMETVDWGTSDEVQQDFLSRTATGKVERSIDE